MVLTADGEGERVDEYEQAEAERKRVLSIDCPMCGRGKGSWCIGAGGKEVRQVGRQHKDRRDRAGARPGLINAILVRRGLI